MTLVLLYIWEEARLWAYSLDKQFNYDYLGPGFCFSPSWIPLRVYHQGWLLRQIGWWKITFFVYWTCRQLVFSCLQRDESESEVTQSCLTLCDPVDPPGSSIHGILQARILEWVAISFSRGSSQPKDWTQVSHIAGRHFNLWATREAQRDSLG